MKNGTSDQAQYQHIVIAGTKAAVNEALLVLPLPVIIGKKNPISFVPTKLRAYHAGEPLPIKDMRFTNECPECYNGFFLRRDEPAKVMSYCPIGSIGYTFSAYLADRSDAVQLKKQIDELTQGSASIRIDSQARRVPTSWRERFGWGYNIEDTKLEGVISVTSPHLPSILNMHKDLSKRLPHSCGQIRFSTDPLKFLLGESLTF